MRWTEPSSEATSVRPIQPVHGDAEVHRDWFGGPSVLHDVDYGSVWMKKAADKIAGVTLIDADETRYDMATSKPRRHTVWQHIRSMYELPGSYSADSGVVVYVYSFRTPQDAYDCDLARVGADMWKGVVQVRKDVKRNVGA